MMKFSLLSRNIYYEATHGILQAQKDYISVVKDQGSEGLCWAYALTSTIEMKFALDTGNRFMLDPRTLSNNSVKWFKENDKKCQKLSDKTFCDQCKEYDTEGGYRPDCALYFMLLSSQRMRRMDGNNSNLIISNADPLEITNLTELYTALDKYKIIYSGIDADYLIEQGFPMVITNYIDSTKINHAVVILSAGKFIESTGIDGIYLEVLNSWGYNRHSDGIAYIKIADNENDVLHNNLNIFDTNYGIEVDEMVSQEEITLLVLCIIFGIFTIVLIIVVIILAYKCHKASFKDDNSRLEENLNKDDTHNEPKTGEAL